MQNCCYYVGKNKTASIENKTASIDGTYNVNGVWHIMPHTALNTFDYHVRLFRVKAIHFFI